MREPSRLALSSAAWVILLAPVSCQLESPVVHRGDKDGVVSTAGAVDSAAWDALCKLQGLAAGCDLCAALGWYQDGVCDDFCPGPDPDCSAACGWCAAPDTSGPHYYVSTSGSDSSPGTVAAPFRTIAYAYDNYAAPGVTITVLPGTYTDYDASFGSLHLGASGTAEQPIVLRSQVRSGAVLDGLDDPNRTYVIYLDGSYNVVWGFTITRAGGMGISTWARGNQILANEICNNARSGVYSSAETSDDVYACNYVHDNGQAGADDDYGFNLGGKNERVFNNILVRNGTIGLQIAGYSTVQNMKVYNNVMADNGAEGIALWLTLDGVEIKNNILSGNAIWGLHSWDAHGSGVVIDHNLVYGNGSGDYDFTSGGSDYAYTLGTTLTGDPLFVSNASDFHLQPGSPAIDSGLTLSEITTDLDCAPRPQGGGYDVGAFER